MVRNRTSVQVHSQSVASVSLFTFYDKVASDNRAVGIAILLCFSGVALITQPSFLGFPDTGRITALGAFFALFQVCSPAPVNQS